MPYGMSGKRRLQMARAMGDVGNLSEKEIRQASRRPKLPSGVTLKKGKAYVDGVPLGTLADGPLRTRRPAKGNRTLDQLKP